MLKLEFVMFSNACMSYIRTSENRDPHLHYVYRFSAPYLYPPPAHTHTPPSDYPVCGNRAGGAGSESVGSNVRGQEIPTEELRSP